MRTNSKNRADAHGRSKKPVGGFSRITTDMQRTVAFQSLTGSALRVLMWACFRNFNAATNTTASEKPKFKFTNAEAKSKLGMNSSTFSRAKNELNEKGFIDWAKRGGLKGVNGAPSLYCLSGKYKDWTPAPKTENKNLIKARAIKKSLKDNDDLLKGYGKNLKSVKQVR